MIYFDSDIQAVSGKVDGKVCDDWGIIGVDLGTKSISLPYLTPKGESLENRKGCFRGNTPVQTYHYPANVDLVITQKKGKEIKVQWEQK